jgi:hypothetical protein
MARVLLSQGRLRESLGVYRELIKLSPDDASVAREMTEVVARLGLADPLAGSTPAGRSRRRVILSSLLERVGGRRKRPSLWPRIPLPVWPVENDKAISPEWIAHEKRTRIIRFLGVMLDRVAARRRG